MPTINSALLQSVHGLQDVLKQGMQPTDPIRLSPATQFVANKAALVFVSPHVIDASKDIATFGDTGVSPHPGASVFAWFKAPAANTTVLVDFVCQAFLASSSEEAGVNHSTFTLKASSQTEATASTGSEQHVAFVGTFPSQWRSVQVSCSGYWKLVRCEITVLTKP